MAVLLDREIAVYDDSFQPTGGVSVQGFPPTPHFEMKKLHHSLRLHIEGPDGTDVNGCLNQAAVGALIAAIAAAAATGGSAAAGAAFNAGSTVLATCLGGKCQVSLPDNSSWVTWWT